MFKNEKVKKILTIAAVAFVVILIVFKVSAIKSFVVGS
jgi:hypothetical protein